MTDVATRCDRASATRTAPVRLLDALVADLATRADPAAREARIDRFMADVDAAGGTPLQGMDEVVFVARGDGPWTVGLSTHAWSPTDTPLRQLGTSTLWLRHEPLSASSYTEYKLVQGHAHWLQDLHAQSVVWDGVDHGAPGEFNAVVHPAAGDANRGRTVAMRNVTSSQDPGTRDVFVHVPIAYDRAPCPALPLLFVHDGNESLTRHPFDTAADAAFASGTRPALLAFVALPSQDVRMDEYTFDTPTARGDAYGRFLFTELEPLLTARFRVRPGRDCRGLVGASLGGLISMYLAYTQPSYVALVGAQSGSFFWDPGALITRVRSGAAQDLRVYLDSGDRGDGQDNLPYVTQMDHALATHGYDRTRVTRPGAGHDWPDWQQRWPAMLSWLLRPGRCD